MTTSPPGLVESVTRALVLYSLAEFQSAACTTINVELREDGFTVTDDGRGHAIDRTVDGVPYLNFVYSHLDYPFGSSTNAPVQLQGIGISLINALCSELEVTVCKTDRVLRVLFRNGVLCEQQRVDASSTVTGNSIRGAIDPRYRDSAVDADGLREWLIGIASAAPSLELYLDGQRVQPLDV